MKANLYFFLFVLFSTFASAQTVSKTLNVSTAGTLNSLLTADEKNTITNLTLSGNIDARDFTCMRDELIVLKEIDLSAAIIVAYNGPGGTYSSKTNYLANQIPEYAFSNSTTSKGKASLTHILLPANLSSIDNYAFFNCTGLLDIVIPNTVESIGEGAFKYCSNMTSVTLSNSLKKIESTVFYRCYFLTSVIIPNSVTEIGSSAFYQCSNLASINIPNSVKSIGNFAFEGCGWATSITLGSGIENIGTEVFKDCISITYVSINKSVGPSINSSTFSGMQEWLVLFEVPIGRAPNYTSAPGWVEFSNIKEKDFSTKLNAFENDFTNIYTSPSGIIIDGTAKGEIIAVYSISGAQKHLIKSEGGQVTIPVSKSAIYLVKTASKTIKVVL
jgi:hypothetical protein